MKLLAATRSRGKQPEIRRILEPAGVEVVFPDDLGLWETPVEDTLELAESFEGNARRKAEHFARLTGLPTVADDSGLEVFALGGAPGVRSRRWAGATGSSDRGRRGQQRGAAAPAAGRARGPAAGALSLRAGLPARRRRRARGVRGHLRRPDPRGAARARAGSATIRSSSATSWAAPSARRRPRRRTR